ncbi:hypothetical protein JMJ56_10370 [Belnapia sp. T18]|uniref:Lipoprotein n=1 Tax=Belnapia arida TaxID=2804533 RepID=A0ABS1U146_9PROT|nr:hypothetical protein [Belnapia arida]MBL6078410.1 hypothetical protein [Belnapia arida]
MVLKHAAMALLLAGLAGCASRSATPLPNPQILAAHEWEHGPPWGPEELPWVPPLETYASYDPYPWSWTGPAIGIRRGFWWGGHRGHYRGGLIGRGGFHRGFHGGGHFGRGRHGRR